MTNNQNGYQQEVQETMPLQFSIVSSQAVLLALELLKMYMVFVQFRTCLMLTLMVAFWKRITMQKEKSETI